MCARNRSSFVNKHVKSEEIDRGNRIATIYIVVPANIPQAYMHVMYVHVYSVSNATCACA